MKFSSKELFSKCDKSVNVSCGFGSIYRKNPQSKPLVYCATRYKKSKLLSITLHNSPLLPIVLEVRKFFSKNDMVPLNIVV